MIPFPDISWTKHKHYTSSTVLLFLYWIQSGIPGCIGWRTWHTLEMISSSVTCLSVIIIIASIETSHPAEQCATHCFLDYYKIETVYVCVSVRDRERLRVKADHTNTRVYCMPIRFLLIPIYVHRENLILYLIWRAVMACTYMVYSVQIKTIIRDSLSHLPNHLADIL